MVTQPGNDEPVVQEGTPAVETVETQVGLGPLEDVAGVAEPEAPIVEPPVAEAPVAEAPVAEEPTAPVEEGAPPAPPPVVAPPIDPIRQEMDALRQQVTQSTAQLAQREAQALDQENARGFQAAVAALQTEMAEQEGLAPERAQAIAQRVIGADWRAYNAERNAQNQVAEVSAKFQVAIQLAEQYKVPVDSLLQHNSPQAMKEAAERVAAQGKLEARLAAVEAENAQLKKGQLPSGQRFESGRGAIAPTGGRKSKLERYADGEELPEKDLAELFQQ